jgi:hypothetical protein
MLNPPVDGPRGEYLARRDQRRAVEAGLRRRLDRIGQGRLITFLAAAGCTWLAFGPAVAPAWLIAVPAVQLVYLLYLYERVARPMRRSGRAARFYERGLDRLDDRWAGTGEAGTRYADDHHLYATDLDLFGKGSLFERLCLARAKPGQDVLAEWLLAPAAASEIPRRQEAVDELRSRLDLREQMALLGDEVPGGVDFARLQTWGESPPVLQARALRAATGLLGSLNFITLGLWLAGYGAIPFAVSALASMVLFASVRVRVRGVLAAVERSERDLGLLAGLLGRLESESFASERLKVLRSALDTSGVPPSRRIAQLARLVELLNSQRNQMFAIPAALMLWPVQIAFLVEVWRAVSGRGVGRWTAAVAEFEALASLAGYAYENPGDPFPEIAAEGGGCFEAVALGHPLMPAGRCVRNDVSIGRGVRVLVVSGSNMSGKSTLLRSVGINSVLALAGAPVRAESLRVSPLAVGATLRVLDSLQEGKSRFYAEITRVRQLVDLSKGPLPLLFLLDELFSGTNSHDRQVGADAVVRRLVESGAIGLLTTHDLALTRLADELAPRAVNVHFADTMEKGTLTFDYRMHAGVVRHSNALALMRAVGLEV